MLSSIAVVGVGGIGRRHLEALAKARNNLRIFVIDPNSNSLAFAQYHASTVFKTLAAMTFHNNAEALPEELDLAIIATTADVRRRALETLLSRSRPRYLVLEKPLFQEIGDYEAVAKRLDAGGVTAWVNCPRRMWPQYVQLRDQLAGSLDLTMHVVTGPGTGLGSNAIHMIDLLAFLSRDSEIEVDASRLHAYQGPTKRNSVEFTGTLIVTTRTGATLFYTAFSQGSNPLRLSVEAPGFRLLFEEFAYEAQRSDAAGGWKWQTNNAGPIFQSSLTNLVADQLIEQGICGLTPYSESAALHLPMVLAMRDRLAALGLLVNGGVRIT